MCTSTTAPAMRLYRYSDYTTRKDPKCKIVTMSKFDIGQCVVAPHDILGYYKGYVGNCTYKCSVSDCHEQATRSNYVAFGNRRSLYLVPMCQSCTCTRLYEYGYYMFDKSGYALEMYDRKWRVTCYVWIRIALNKIFLTR